VDQHVARIVVSGANQGVAWYLTDWQGSTRNLIDSSGNLQDTIAYDGFGNITSESASTFSDQYKYTGLALDSASGLYYGRGRYYDPRTGRWTTQDPLGFGGGSPAVSAACWKKGASYK
jgi:RHS repeat-associated protein